MNLLDNPIHDALNESARQAAPPCPECGSPASEAKVERHTQYGDDIVTYAGEFYRCSNGHRFARRLELDRITKEEQEEERHKAFARIDYVNEERKTFWGRFRNLHREALRMWPPRPEPDLFEAYMAARKNQPDSDK